MHRIFCLRTITPAHNAFQEPKTKTSLVPFSKDVSFSSLSEFFARTESVIEQIHADNRTNLYYTLYETSHSFQEPKARPFVKQKYLAFDCDKMTISQDGSYSEKYINTFFKVTGLDPDKTAVIFSGNGLHFIVGLAEEITSIDYFKSNKKLYTLACSRLTAGLLDEGLAGEFDPVIFDPQRVMRMPGSWNEKIGKPRRMCQMVQPILLPQNIDLKELAGGGKTKKEKLSVKTPKAPLLPEEKATNPADDEIPDKAIKRLNFDENAVLSGCPFLVHVKENQKEISEPAWQAAISILSKLPNGKELVHDYSNKHPQYSSAETNAKYAFATKSGAGPRTCENISTLWTGCGTCPHLNSNITSPLFIAGDDHIISADNGFMLVGKRGSLAPDYVGLRKQFHKDHPYFVDVKSQEIFIYGGAHYTIWEELRFKKYAQDKFFPEQPERVIIEWVQRLKRDNQVRNDEFNTPGFINFSNGVLEVSTGKVLEHSPELKFLYTLPYPYDKTATCPEFDAMLKRITLERKDIEQTLLEFTGYGVCERDYWLEKCLLLVGSGANGKSTFLDVVKNLAGKGNYSVCGLGELKDEKYRHSLLGKLCNISEEMPTQRMYASDLFKKLFGGEVNYRMVYGHPGSFTCTAKLFFACNELPESSDLSDGYFRRIVVVPFDAKFGDTERDYTLKKKLLEETPGIFNRVYAAWGALKKRSYLLEAEAVKQELQDYKHDSDSIGSWFGSHVDICSLDTGERLSSTSLFNQFRSHQQSTGDTYKYSQMKFSQGVKRCLPDYRQRHYKYQGNMSYKGLRWKDAGVYKNGKDHPAAVEKEGSGSGLDLTL